MKIPVVSVLKQFEGIDYQVTNQGVLYSVEGNQITVTNMMNNTETLYPSKLEEIVKDLKEGKAFGFTSIFNPKLKKNFIYNSDIREFSYIKDHMTHLLCKESEKGFDCAGTRGDIGIGKHKSLSDEYRLVSNPALQASYCQKLHNRVQEQIYEKCETISSADVENHLQKYLGSDLVPMPGILDEANHYNQLCLGSKYAIIAGGIGGTIYSVYKLIESKGKVDPDPKKQSVGEQMKAVAWFAASVGSLVGSFYLQSFIPGKI